MEINLTQPDSTLPTKPLTTEQIKAEMKKRRGFTPASYARLIKRSKSASTRLINGEIGGELRERFLRFFGFDSNEVPTMKEKPCKKCGGTKVKVWHYGPSGTHIRIWRCKDCGAKQKIADHE